MAAAMVKKYGPLAGMLYVQVPYGAMFLISRFALTRGMSHYAFVLYRQLIASVAIFPAAYYFNSSMQLSTLSWKNLKHIFFLALIGTSISQNFYYAGLALTSSTFVSTMNNLQPAITFLLAYLLKLEEVKIRRLEGQAKVVGTLVCVGGAVVMTLSKVHGEGLHEVLKLVVHGEENDAGFIFGAILTVIGSSSWSLFVIYQAWIVEEYPSQLTLSALVSVMGSLQVIVIAFTFENPRALILHFGSQLLAVSYSGIFCSGLGAFTIMWCVKEKGPVYSTAFNPLATLLVAILEPLLLHVKLTWSSLTGMAMVIGGLYLYLWGKAQDVKPSNNTLTQCSNGISGGECNSNEIIMRREEVGNQEPLLA
ncbi:WAT1-related protein At2g37460-like [Zingiber officinale]|uniref:WAT1-related protein At2g37460-like n=1 Tax=Zingiber officinale TaxID=94328 RepID=UPI001C4C2DD9|nr:WAT1-related protein At2g37460-like [Zingiber officinale]